VLSLLDRFITAVVGEAEAPNGGSREINTLLGAVHAAVLLELVPHETSFEVQEHDNVSIDRVPLLVVAASLALAGAENKGNKVYSASLLQLLRSPLFLVPLFVALASNFFYHIGCLRPRLFLGFLIYG
jgi:hypothetical protein